MPLTSFPGGVASFGVPLISSGSLYDMPSAEVLFVCNRAGVTSGDGTSRDRPLPSLADAIVKIPTTSGLVSGAAQVFVLAGHTENITGSNIFSGSTVNTTSVTIPAGTRIVGEGQFNARPTFTCTASGSTFALAAANITLENLVIQAPQTGSTTTTVGVTVTAGGCMVNNCLFITSGGTASLFTTAINLSSAVTQFWLVNTTAYAGAGTGAPTNFIATTGTTGAQNVFVINNNLAIALNATTSGLIDVSSASGTAPVNWNIFGNILTNLIASSTVVIKGVASWTGNCANNRFGLGVTTNTTTTSINTPASLMSWENYCTSGGKWGIVGGGTAAQTS